MGDGEATSGGDLTIDQAFQLALSVQKQGYLESADKIYERVLAVAPDHLDALHFKGLGRYRMGRQAEGLEMLQHVVARDPRNLAARVNLANMLAENNRLAEAREAYQQMLAQDPDCVVAYTNLGVVLRKQDDLAGAEAAFRKAVELDPKHPAALHNLASLMWDLDRIPEALTFYQQSLILTPYDIESYRRVGALLAALDRTEEATAVYERWRELEPDSQLVPHLIAACSGRNVPSRASDQFVASTFDLFAETFDVVLARLDYRAPALVAEAVAVALGAPASTRDVLDAGVGTGLCGPALRPYARKLNGIDLSPLMLEKAKARSAYDELVVAELTAYMREHPAAFDVVVSADTLCYFGELDQAFAAAATALRPGGHLVFTVEHVPAELGVDHRLNSHGRYSHSEAYLRRALATAGLTPVAIEPAVLRLQNKLPVDGLVVTAERGRASQLTR